MEKMRRYQSSTTNEKAIQKSLDRMKIMSMVPTEIDPANSSPEFISALDQNWDICRNTISNFSQTLEYAQRDDIAFDDEPKVKDESKYTITSYKPSFINSPSQLPEPATYYPNYLATKKAAPQNSIRELPRPLKVPNATTADIVDQYQTNMRAFEPKNIQNASDNLIISSDIKETDHKYHYTFSDQSNRNFELSRKTMTKNLDFFKPQSPKIIGVDFNSMQDRELDIKQDSGRDYDVPAFDQYMKLHDKCRVPTITKQMTRDYKPPKNERVSFIEKLTDEQNSLLKKFSPERSRSVTKPRKVISSFTNQLSRENDIKKPTATEKYRESKYNVDPAKSFKHVWPRVPYTTIRPIPKFESPKKEKNFWSAF